MGVDGFDRSRVRTLAACIILYGMYSTCTTSCQWTCALAAFGMALVSSFFYTLLWPVCAPWLVFYVSSYP